MVQVSSKNLHTQPIWARDLISFRECSPAFMCHLLHVKCHLSPLTSHASHVTCHILFYFFFQNGEARQSRVCYQWGYPVYFITLYLSLNQIQAHSEKGAIVSERHSLRHLLVISGQIPGNLVLR